MNISVEPIADSVPVAAKRLGISRSQAFVEIKERRLTARKAGSRTLVERVEQERWLQSLPEAAAP